MTKQNPRVSSAEMLRHLARKMGTLSDHQLENLLGITHETLIKWKNESTSLTPLQVANAVAKAHHAAQSHVHKHAILPIVEFFPIDSVAVGKEGKQLAVFPTDKNSGQHYLGLYKQLSGAKSGLYVFYDTRGRALYAGQTKKQNIWKEMNLAFNRDRSAQIITLVRHPTRDVEFKPAHSKVRQPRDCTLKLHDLAAYFSVYEVIPEMVDNLEALLIRAFPNDLLNFKMEKFGEASSVVSKASATKAATKKPK